jgi:pimeloyl-ACP methyl ester carboxylesterase
VTTTAANFGRVPRVYIECLQDRTIGPAAQKQMYTALPCEKVITLNTSHNPYLSAPESLANHLLALA